MTLEFLNELIEKKINQNKNFLKFTFYELVVKNNLPKDDCNATTQLIKRKLINYGYKVYLTGESFTYNSISYTIPNNILLIAIKNSTLT